jgi:very-short-patch-repair endonuclease
LTGKKLSAEHVANIRASRTGEPLSDDHREKISKSSKGNPSHKRPFIEKLKNKYGDDWEQHYEAFKAKMKGVFTLDWFISKHGEEEGKRLYEERSRNVSDTCHFRTFNRTNRVNYSQMSQKLFWTLFNELQEELPSIYFAELNHEHACGTGRNNYDFVALDAHKIIEFNGDMFHPNRQRLSEEEWKSWANPYTKQGAEEVWRTDQEKLGRATAKGFQILVVWESEFKANEQEVIEKCLNFLKG